MDDKLYLIDIDNANSFSEDFNSFFTDFVCSTPTAILTKQHSSALPTVWLNNAAYVFASDGHELYTYGKLRYKNVLIVSQEVQRWVDSKQLPTTRNLYNVSLVADPYTSASLVREFNETFNEFRAACQANGFYISDCSDHRRNIPALISSNYSIRFVTPIALVGATNYALAQAVSKRGTVFHANTESELRELLLFLEEK